MGRKIMRRNTRKKTQRKPRRKTQRRIKHKRTISRLRGGAPKKKPKKGSKKHPRGSVLANCDTCRKGAGTCLKRGKPHHLPVATRSDLETIRLEHAACGIKRPATGPGIPSLALGDMYPDDEDDYEDDDDDSSEPFDPPPIVRAHSPPRSDRLPTMDAEVEELSQLRTKCAGQRKRRYDPRSLPRFRSLGEEPAAFPDFSSKPADDMM